MDVRKYKESWAPKNWCFWTVVLENTLESSLDCKEIKPVNPSGNQSWIFIGWTDLEAETSIIWPPDVKSWLTGKDLDAGKDWRQEKKGTTEDGMVGWRHRLDGHGFEQALGVGNGQGSLVRCSPWGCKESDTNELLNWADFSFFLLYLNFHSVLLVSATQQWESVLMIHLTPLSWASFPPCSPLSSPLVIMESQTGLLVLYTNFSPAIYFTHSCIYMLMLLSPFVPLSPSLTMSTNPFSTPASPFLPWK